MSMSQMKVKQAHNVIFCIISHVSDYWIKDWDHVDYKITKLFIFCILNTFVLFMLRGWCAFDGKAFLFVKWILHHALITKVHKKQRSNKARGRVIMGWSILLCHIFLQGNADLSTFWKCPLLMTWLLINVSIAFSQSTDVQTFSE